MGSAGQIQTLEYRVLSSHFPQKPRLTIPAAYFSTLNSTLNSPSPSCMIHVSSQKGKPLGIGCKPNLMLLQRRSLVKGNPGTQNHIWKLNKEPPRSNVG